MWVRQSVSHSIAACVYGSLPHQVEFEATDRFGFDPLAVFVLEADGVLRTLNDAGAAADAAFGVGMEGWISRISGRTYVL